jgi:methionyl-tRNA synthetase
MSAPRRTIVVAATPTPNGDLHLGHMAGPYLAADVYARYRRSTGAEVVYTTCTDNSQTYVVTTAHRQGITPQQLCANSTKAIERSLGAMGISVGSLPPIDDTYRQTVLDFVTALYDAGRFQARKVRLPVTSRSGTYLYDGLITGTCPSCLAGSSGGVCEACGHPNNFDELLDPRSTMDQDDPVTYRERTILVLPMESYRDQLTAYFDGQLGRWRPHGMQLIHELLARPLPDIPVTIPGMWGIAAPFAETPGQVLYPWFEGIPAVMYSTWWAAGDRTVAVDEHWRAGNGAELVYFHGFDNVYHWGLMDLVTLMAHGDRYTPPSANVCNEFYDLGADKFSTSRNHLIWTVDLLAEIPRDLVRFYLASTAPETQRTAFTKDALHRVTAAKLIKPWARLTEVMPLVGDGRPLPTTAAGRARAAAMTERFRTSYDLPGFSPNRAADTVVSQLARLADARIAHGDLLLEVRTLLAGAAPILIDIAAQAVAAGVDLTLTADQPAAITPFALPALPSLDAMARGDRQTTRVP